MRSEITLSSEGPPMKITEATAAASILAVVLLSSVGAQAVEPAPSLTKTQAEVAFASAVIFTCLTRQERGGSIDDLPAEYRSDLTLADGSDQKWPSNEQPTGRVWISRTLGSHLRVATLGSGKCQVIADQIPVDETLRKTQLSVEKLNQPFSPVQVKPGYNPVVYEDERVTNGTRIIIHQEGAEPGAPGHLSRFSLLIATVSTE
jgi:hypothetical protein